MKAITIVPNSYFVKLDSNQRFDDHVDNTLQNYRSNNSQVDWWDPKNPNNQPLHCTISQATGTQNNSLKFHQALSNKISSIFQNVDHSHLLSIKDFDITKNGWIILNFKPTKSLQSLHDNVAQTLKNNGLKIQDKFSFNNFKAHVSIGSLKQNGDPIKAAKEVQKLIKDLNDNPCPFNAYATSFEYTTPQKQKQILTQHTFNRIDLGIKRVEKKQGKFIVKTKTSDTAKKVAHVFKKRYGIESSKKPGQKKIVKKINNEFALSLSQKEFDKVSGHFKNLK